MVVVEIGPGLGSLTLALLETGAAVTAVELDRFVLPVLRHIVEPKGATVVQGDALEVDWHALLGDDPGWVLVANLPYNVATPLVLTVLERAPMVRRLLVMVQREVGERFAASPGSKAYGAVSVKVQWSATSSIAGKVPMYASAPPLATRSRPASLLPTDTSWLRGNNTRRRGSSPASSRAATVRFPRSSGPVTTGPCSRVTMTSGKCS